jgi:hypothetical protein
MADTPPAPPAGSTNATEPSRATSTTPGAGWTQYPLLQALLERRSRRFGKGFHLPAGPLAYRSAQPAQPLDLREQAALAFAACGITGPITADLPFAPVGAGGGNIITHLVGRTVASGDALHCAGVLVVDDGGVWYLRRPQDFPRSEIGELAALGRAGRLVELYERSRVRLAGARPLVRRAFPFMPSFNAWSAHQPGSTCFLPVNELSALYINLLLAAFEPENACYLLDERVRYQPAGLRRFARSRGGHLDDDPAAGRVATIGFVETWLCEFAAVEQGGMLQNLGLMAQALGLGGFPYFAAHAFGEFQACGFRMVDVPFSRTIGAGPLTAALLRLLGKDRPMPTAVGLEIDGQALIKPFCPPYYASMREAVLAFVDYKFGVPYGTLRDGGAAAAWQDGGAVQAGIPAPTAAAVEATIAYCEYVYERYGRFPALSGPLRTILGYQAHHLDLDFYRRFYHPAAIGETQREHDQRWHG